MALNEMGMYTPADDPTAAQSQPQNTSPIYGYNNGQSTFSPTTGPAIDLRQVPGATNQAPTTPSAGSSAPAPGGYQPAVAAAQQLGMQNIADAMKQLPGLLQQNGINPQTGQPLSGAPSVGQTSNIAPYNPQYGDNTYKDYFGNTLTEQGTGMYLDPKSSQQLAGIFGAGLYTPPPSANIYGSPYQRQEVVFDSGNSIDPAQLSKLYQDALAQRDKYGDSYYVAKMNEINQLLNTDKSSQTQAYLLPTTNPGQLDSGTNATMARNLATQQAQQTPGTYQAGIQGAWYNPQNGQYSSPTAPLQPQAANTAPTQQASASNTQGTGLYAPSNQPNTQTGTPNYYGNQGMQTGTSGPTNNNATNSMPAYNNNSNYYLNGTTAGQAANSGASPGASNSIFQSGLYSQPGNSSAGAGGGSIGGLNQPAGVRGSNTISQSNPYAQQASRQANTWAGSLPNGAGSLGRK